MKSKKNIVYEHDFIFYVKQKMNNANSVSIGRCCCDYQ